VPDSTTVQDSPADSPPNLADRVRRAALDHGDRPALHWRDRRVSWSELDAAVTAAAYGLAAAVPPTEPDGTPPRVAIALPNTPDLVIGWLGALRAGLVAVPVNPGFTAPELRHVLADSGASLLIGTERVRGLVAEVAADLPALTAVYDTPPTAQQPEPSPRPRRGGDDLAVLLYTSGTEGRPKGAMLSHRALLANQEQVDAIEPRVVGPDSEVLWRDGQAVPDDDTDELDISDVGPGTDPGQIVVRGPNLFDGYWPDGRDGPDADGWWGTGDIAYADADGDLFLVDRLGALILVNGFNVYPHEVELVLGGHPGVAESAVLGVPHPRTGETVRAYVVPAPGRPVSGEELLAHCARNLARFKCPTAVEFVDALPHSAIGKVRKTQLRSATPAGPPAPADDARTEVPDGH
jgi:acyl-CoA synthetase (AMP-forming)/AMP-acid ligase II